MRWLSLFRRSGLTKFTCKKITQTEHTARIRDQTNDEEFYISLNRPATLKSWPQKIIVVAVREEIIRMWRDVDAVNVLHRAGHHAQIVDAG